MTWWKAERGKAVDPESDQWPVISDQQERRRFGPAFAEASAGQDPWREANQRYVSDEGVAESVMAKTAKKKNTKSKSKTAPKARSRKSSNSRTTKPKGKKRGSKKGVVAKVAGSIASAVASVMPGKKKK